MKRSGKNEAVKVIEHALIKRLEKSHNSPRRETEF